MVPPFEGSVERLKKTAPGVLVGSGRIGLTDEDVAINAADVVGLGSTSGSGGPLPSLKTTTRVVIATATAAICPKTTGSDVQNLNNASLDGNRPLPSTHKIELREHTTSLQTQFFRDWKSVAHVSVRAIGRP